MFHIFKSAAPAALCAVLAACTVSTGASGAKAASAEACAQSASQQVALLADTPDYVVDARSFGGPAPVDVDAAAVAAANPCANATVVLTVRRLSDGALVHGFATSMNRMDLIEGHAGPAYDGAKVAAFLADWVKVTVGTANAAPALLPETMTTTLAPDSYAALRAGKARMLCHDISVHDHQCFTISADDAYSLAPFTIEDRS